jgi:predicted transcriptional regulator
MTKLMVHVGDAADMGRRFVEAFDRAQAGQSVDERHITFLSLEAMMAALSPKRLELLRFLHHQRVDSINSLASELGRDYKRVHEDVTMLEKAGLIVRHNGQLEAPWDSLTAEVTL